MKTYQLYINGHYVDSKSGKTLDVIDPSTTELIAKTPDANAADVDAAVQAARRAFDEGPWKDAAAILRRRIFPGVLIEGAAVQAARRAFDEGPWKDATAQDRGRVLFKLAQIVRDRADELAELETRNSGKPIVESE